MGGGLQQLTAGSGNLGFNLKYQVVTEKSSSNGWKSKILQTTKQLFLIFGVYHVYHVKSIAAE
jgi:hypothetical protein